MQEKNEATKLHSCFYLSLKVCPAFYRDLGGISWQCLTSLFWLHSVLSSLLWLLGLGATSSSLFSIKQESQPLGLLSFLFWGCEHQLYILGSLFPSVWLLLPPCPGIK